MDPEEVKQYTFFHGRGCEDCNYTGYKGRLGIFEMLMISDKIRDLILERASTAEISRRAREDGMMSMREDGWQKILAGVTTIDEVLRVTFGFEDLSVTANAPLPGKEEVKPVPAAKQTPAAGSTGEEADHIITEKNTTGEEADRA